MKLSRYLEETDTTQAEFASRLDVTQGRVWQWLNGDRVPAERVLEIERATEGKVSRHDLRPDLYPRDNAAA
jgi:DNA-binding transcriptional regulator YdaS (Cro superfamily)